MLLFLRQSYVYGIKLFKEFCIIFQFNKISLQGYSKIIIPKHMKSYNSESFNHNLCIKNSFYSFEKFE